jgi:hypothetical protein
MTEPSTNTNTAEQEHNRLVRQIRALRDLAVEAVYCPSCGAKPKDQCVTLVSPPSPTRTHARRYDSLDVTVRGRTGD